MVLLGFWVGIYDELKPESYQSGVVLGGLFLQLVIAFGVLKIEWVENCLGMSLIFAIALKYRLMLLPLFGPLANFEKMNEVFLVRASSLPLWPCLAFSSFGVIIAALLFWFASICGERHGLVDEFGYVCRAESLAAGNIFVGQTEAFNCETLHCQNDPIRNSRIDGWRYGHDSWLCICHLYGNTWRDRRIV